MMTKPEVLMDGDFLITTQDEEVTYERKGLFLENGFFHIYDSEDGAVVAVYNADYVVSVELLSEEDEMNE